jgi:hypothetical protein
MTEALAHCKRTERSPTASPAACEKPEPAQQNLSRSGYATQVPRRQDTGLADMPADRNTSQHAWKTKMAAIDRGPF